MDVTFTKTGKKQNWINVTKSDGSKDSFPWPEHPGLPHDAIHLVVEQVFRLRNGFWGLFAQGVDLMTLNKAVDRARTGIKVKDLAGRDTTELYQAEALVACFGNEMLWSGPKVPQERRETLAEGCEKWGVPFPARYNDHDAGKADAELGELLVQWNQLRAGESLTVVFGA